MEAYGWFVTGGLPLPGGEVWVEVAPLAPGRRLRFPDYQSFYRYLTGIFPRRWWTAPFWPGQLPGTGWQTVYPGQYPGENRFIGGADYALVSETDSRREIMATAYFVKGAQEYLFVQKVDSKWLFTQFPYFY